MAVATDENWLLRQTTVPADLRYFWDPARMALRKPANEQFSMRLVPSVTLAWMALSPG
jgi:hypothetical protein